MRIAKALLLWGALLFAPAALAGEAAPAAEPTPPAAAAAESGPPTAASESGPSTDMATKELTEDDFAPGLGIFALLMLILIIIVLVVAVVAVLLLIAAAIAAIFGVSLGAFFFARWRKKKKDRGGD